jgi:hypothetical protein
MKKYLGDFLGLCLRPGPGATAIRLVAWPFKLLYCFRSPDITRMQLGFVQRKRPHPRSFRGLVHGRPRIGSSSRQTAFLLTFNLGRNKNPAGTFSRAVRPGRACGREDECPQLRNSPGSSKAGGTNPSGIYSKSWLSQTKLGEEQNAEPE